jgi:hypothetical protein
MKRILSSNVLKAAFALAVLLAAVISAHPAAAGKPTITEVPNVPALLPAGQYCPSFDVQYTPLKQNETRKTFYIQDYSMQIVSGPLVASFTNMKTGYSMTINISGPERKIVNSTAGTLTVHYLGNWMIWGSPQVQGLPPIAYNKGQLTFIFDATGVHWSQTGKLQNLCDLLNH